LFPGIGICQIFVLEPVDQQCRGFDEVIEFLVDTLLVPRTAEVVTERARIRLTIVSTAEYPRMVRSWFLRSTP